MELDDVVGLHTHIKVSYYVTHYSAEIWTEKDQMLLDANGTSVTDAIFELSLKLQAWTSLENLHALAT